MAVEVSRALPPLRRKIRNSFLVLIVLYALLGVFMMVSVFLASGTTPKVIHVNYDSIVAAREMDEAWNALAAPALHPQKSLDQWSAQFEHAMTFEAGNITEPGEGGLARNIRKIWDGVQSRRHPLDLATYTKMTDELHALVKVNEKGMFRAAENSTEFGRRVFVVALVFFLVTLFFAIFLVDGLAERLARPMKGIAEAIRGDPGMTHRLKLPAPQSLEMRILSKEITDLWERISKFQKLNIERITTERERLETVLSSIEDAVLVLDNQSRVIQVNEGMLRLLNLANSDVTGHRWMDLPTIHENYLKLRERLRSDAPTENSFELTLESGNRIYAARNRQITASGQTAGEVYLLHDITEMRHRERLKTEFLSVLSHELKTPLQSLGTAAELLGNRAERFDEDTRMLVETLGEDVSRIRAVAQDFMQVSVDLHSLKIKLEKVPLSQLVQEWIKPFKVLARDRNVKLEFIKEGSEVIWAKADVVKLPWAISNLLANAIRVSPPESTVTVYMTDRSGAADIEIRDEGPGIPPVVRERMWEPFYQNKAGDGGASAGFLGLGLTIAKEVVEAHEGKIEYFPREPKGSVFRISVPYEIVYQ